VSKGVGREEGGCGGGGRGPIVSLRSH
jgi:hypothetical protein